MVLRYLDVHVAPGHSSDDPIPLVLAAQRGDRSAMARLLAKYSPLVHRCVRCYLPGMEFDDLLQQGFLILMELVHEYDAGRGVPFGVYLLHKFPWRLYHYVRARLAAAGREEPLDCDTTPLSPQSTRSTPSNDAHITDAVSLESALGLLTLPQQTALRLHYWDDLAVEEIARSWDVSPQGVRQLLARAQARLKAVMNGEEITSTGP